MSMTVRNSRTKPIAKRRGWLSPSAFPLCLVVTGLVLVTLNLACTKRESLSSKYSFLNFRVGAPPDIAGDSARWASARAAMPFDSISMSRSCDDNCPAYTILLSRDGSARYIGSAGSQREGEWGGSVDFLDYARLCQFIETTGVLNVLPDSSHIRINHGWKFDLRLWRTGKRVPLRFTGWEVQGPTEAWLVRSAIDGIAARIVWTRSK